MNFAKRIFSLLLLLLALPTFAQSPPTLADFWDGRAEWMLDIVDVGLPDIAMTGLTDSGID